jgi:hypothetical protein
LRRIEHPCLKFGIEQTIVKTIVHIKEDNIVPGARGLRPCRLSEKPPHIRKGTFFYCGLKMPGFRARKKYPEIIPEQITVRSVYAGFSG